MGEDTAAADRPPGSASPELTVPASQSTDPFGVEGYRDDRYRFQGFSTDFLIGLGRLSLGASYLESTIATMLWRLIENDDLQLGERLTADANFRWLVDHTRAVSEHRLPAALHARLADWLGRSQRAYGDRNKIVHSGHAISVRSDGSGLAHVWVRGSARGKSFSQEVRPAEAAELHEIAVRLERLGLEGVNLMTPVQEVLQEHRRS